MPNEFRAMRMPRLKSATALKMISLLAFVFVNLGASSSS